MIEELLMTSYEYLEEFFNNFQGKEIDYCRKWKAKTNYHSIYGNGKIAVTAASSKLRCTDTRTQ